MTDNAVYNELLSHADNIKVPDVRKIVKNELLALPDYFWHKGASSTGKYHPSYANGEGGLARHTAAACRIANHLFNISDFTDIEKDIIIGALILHDGFKYGNQVNNEEHTSFEHPALMAEHIKNKYKDNPAAVKMAEAIHSHMGKWNTNPRSNIVLPKPHSKVDIFVHWCDYIASRKDIEIVF